MRKVNQITFELIKKQFDIKDVKKGEVINILTECRYFKIKAR